MAEEHAAFRERAGIIDMTSFGKIEVSGPGALPLLERVAGNLIDRPVGSVVYTQLLEREGGIAADVTITRLGEEHFRVVTGAGYVNTDLGWLRLQVRDGDRPVELRESTEDFSVIGMWGPLARDILEHVTDDDVSDEGFPFMQARMLRIGGATALAQRVTYVGELGWELYLEPAWAGQVWDRLCAGLGPLAPPPGYRYYGTDLTLLDTPFEAGLGFCVHRDKWTHVSRQVSRRLRTLEVGGEDYVPIYGGEAVLHEGKVISRLRSCGYGFTARRNLAYSYLPVDLKPGGSVEVEEFGSMVPAAVTTDAVVQREHGKG
jgi:4-methylaminobutanoate oxidase (formaldehyde-forming)